MKWMISSSRYVSNKCHRYMPIVGNRYYIIMNIDYVNKFENNLDRQLKDLIQHFK